MSIEKVGEDMQKKVKVKVEKFTNDLNDAKEDLEDAQETLQYVVLSENNKMTEIDQLKEKMKEMQKRIEDLESL